MSTQMNESNLRKDREKDMDQMSGSHGSARSQGYTHAGDPSGWVLRYCQHGYGVEHGRGIGRAWMAMGPAIGQES